jgi:hypothetical protein
MAISRFSSTPIWIVDRKLAWIHPPNRFHQAYCGSIWLVDSEKIKMKDEYGHKE